MENKQLDRRTKYSIRVLQTTLLEILESKSLDSVSVTELCAKADINRGTFYKYYRDIYDLYEQIEDEFVEHLHFLLESSEKSNSNGAELFANVTALLQKSKSFLRPRYRREDASRLLGKLLALVLPGLTSQILLRRPDMNPEKARFLGEYIVGGCARMYDIWIQEKMALPSKAMQDYITSFVEVSMQVK